MKRFILFVAAFRFLCAQDSEVSALVGLNGNSWPTYYGDFSGRRYSPLSQINQNNVGSMTLAWTFKASPGAPPTFEATLDRSASTFTSVPLEVGGTLFLTLADHVWAVDAQTGHLTWHFYRPAPGTHRVNRGVAIVGGRVFFGTADAHLIALDERSGKKIWDERVGDVRFGEAVTMAPLVVHNHVIVGSAGDGADVAGFASALDPDNGKSQWTWHAVPKPGEPASKTWGAGRVGEDTMTHGGGNPSMTPTYDPELNLLYLGTGSPRPAMVGEVRPGPNLFTCSIVALDADTGQIKWYFQTSPHETHNWGSVETPVLFDAEFGGKPRKLLAQAGRNGYYFLLDRVSGKELVSTAFVPVNWSAGVDDDGRPIPRKESDPQPDGVLVTPGEHGATNWPPPSYSPATRLLYVNARIGEYAMFYKTAVGSAPKGLAGSVREVTGGTTALAAINYVNGKVEWTSEAGGLGGVLSTAGGLVFTSGRTNNLVALDADTGKVLWHARVGTMANSAITYELAGRQFVVTPVGDMVYAWVLPAR